MPAIEELRSLLSKLKKSAGPSPRLDQEIGAVLGRSLDGASTPPQWTASIDEASKLFNELLPGRPMDLVPAPEHDGYICSVKLYGSMPATPPCAVHFASTAAMAIMTAMIETLTALEIDFWSLSLTVRTASCRIAALAG
jgi:hypothetical protein